MDVILNLCDEYAFDHAYAYLFPHPPQPSTLLHLNSTAYAHGYVDSAPLPSIKAGSAVPRDNIYRQGVSLYLIALLGAYALYFLFCSISYFFFFDKRLEHHPRFLKNQKWLEIKTSLIAAPVIDALTIPWFLGEVRGKSMLYENVADYGWAYFVGSIGLYLLFTDFWIYWIHRWEHHPRIYKYIHKPHHKWVMPTPWSALAFHPLDGYAQSLPYHVFVYLFPLHKYLYIGLFVFVQLWTILIHDGDMISGHLLERYINSPAHHTLHHLYFTCNYGQYFTWADSYFDSYRAPAPELDPIHESLRMMKKKGLVDEDGKEIPQKNKGE
ncbi:putative C-5 sterol desaturase [Papiliotrema laurentii]|uniref:C-5 sterol desaturase n=2 Tax=Opisthokonta TaxID=33154 RepID=A0AAD9CTI1_PAPLA|nr:putative C-5 sterol desaturase [Papiliotrema laurentii]